MSDYEQMISALSEACGLGHIDRVVIDSSEGVYEAAAIRGEGDHEICTGLVRGGLTSYAARYALARRFFNMANARAARLLNVDWRQFGDR